MGFDFGFVLICFRYVLMAVCLVVVGELEKEDKDNGWRYKKAKAMEIYIGR